MKRGSALLSISLRNHVRIENLRQRMEVTHIVERIYQLEYNWAGHVARMNINTWTKRDLSSAQKPTDALAAYQLTDGVTILKELQIIGLKLLNTKYNECKFKQIWKCCEQYAYKAVVVLFTSSTLLLPVDTLIELKHYIRQTAKSRKQYIFHFPMLSRNKFIDLHPIICRNVHSRPLMLTSKEQCHSLHKLQRRSTNTVKKIPFSKSKSKLIKLF